MAKKALNIGLDVGNFDTKTPNTVTPSGYNEFSKIPYNTVEALIYENVCYVPDNIERFPYERDKTATEKWFNVSLFGIAKEIISIAQQTAESKEELQEKLSGETIINLGVGLPPAHMSNLSEKLITYYKEHFGDKIKLQYYIKVKDFEHAIYDINIKLNKVEVYPQDYAAAFWAPKFLKRQKDANFLTLKYKESGYYAIDIGGYTVDVVPISQGIPQASACESLEYGVLKLYGSIERIIDREFGIVLNDAIIQNVLVGQATVLQKEVVETILDSTQEWIDKIVNEIRKRGLEFNATPVIFLGGGSSLLKTYINRNPIIAKCEHSFLTNSKANAYGYREFLKKTS